MTTAEPTQDRASSWRAPGGLHGRPAATRIAYLLSQYPARSHTFLLQEVLGLRARGLEIETLSINAPDRATDELPQTEAAEARQTFYIKQSGVLFALLAVLRTALTQPGVLMRGIGAIAKLRGLSLRQRSFWLFYLVEAVLIGQWMRQRGLRHLHVHFGGAVASVAMLTSIAWRIPYSLTIHGPEELLQPSAYQLPTKLSQASFVICISDFCRQELQKLLPEAQWPKLTVIRLGVDPLLLAPVSRNESSPHLPLTLVCVGRLVPEKGHTVLLQALALLQARGMTLKAVLIGAGTLRDELQQEAQRLGLGETVTFTAGLSHAQTLAHVRTADMFALASYAEGVPVALMEAMSLGVPCVSTRIAGIPELIHSGQNGLLVAPGDAAAFADALHSLATSATLRQELGNAGRRKILSDYNLPLNLERLAPVLRRHVETVARPQEVER